MRHSMFHIFRNSPLGRENLLQSIYFCRMVGHLRLSVFRPTARQCVMYFEGTVVTLDLDQTYTQFAASAKPHVNDLLTESGVAYEDFEPMDFTAGALPQIPVKWAFMACPRAISEQSSRIGLGRLGPKVRAIVKEAEFPVFIPALCYKEWTSVTAFFGGSDLGLRAVRLGLSLAERADVPFRIVTHLKTTSTHEECIRKLTDAGLSEPLDQPNRQWDLLQQASMEEALYAIPNDTLVVVGAAGDSLIRELVFGSTLELIQSTLPNPIVVVGPHGRDTL